MAILSGTYEQVSAGVFIGGTNFSEYEPAAGIPVGLTQSYRRGANVVLSPSIGTDPTEGNYFQLNKTPNDSPFFADVLEAYIVKVDAFDLVKDEASLVNDSFEMVARVFIHPTGPSANGLVADFGPLYVIDVPDGDFGGTGVRRGRGWQLQEKSDQAIILVDRTVLANGSAGGTDEDPFTPQSGVVNRGEWWWTRQRYIRNGLGDLERYVKYWEGAFSAEPSAWDFQTDGQTETQVDVGLGEIGFGMINGNNTTQQDGQRIAFMSFSTDFSMTNDPTTPFAPGPGEISGGEWLPPDPPPNTAWEECGPAGSVSVALTSTGLVFRDQFARADAQSLGNGWTDWESAATDIQIVSQQVVAAAVARKIGGARPADEVGSSQEILIQMNCFPAGANSICGVRTRWNGVTNTIGYTMRLDVRSGGQWAVVRNNVSILATSSTDPPLVNEWRGIRVVHAGAQIRMLKTPVLVDGTDLAKDFTLILSPTDGTPLTSNNQTGFERDQLASVGNFDEFILCSSKFLTVTGLPSGHKVQVDARAAVVETGGSVVIDVETWALPATTVKILDGDDVEVASVTPGAGVWGGDLYTVTATGGGIPNTPWEPC